MFFFLCDSGSINGVVSVCGGEQRVVCSVDTRRSPTPLSVPELSLQLSSLSQGEVFQFSHPVTGTLIVNLRPTRVILYQGDYLKISVSFWSRGSSNLYICKLDG